MGETTKNGSTTSRPMSCLEKVEELAAKVAERPGGKERVQATRRFL
jgi:hypothetical protein